MSYPPAAIDLSLQVRKVEQEQQIKVLDHVAEDMDAIKIDSVETETVPFDEYS